MKMIHPQTIAFTATVTEDEIRERMAMEVLESSGALDDNGVVVPGVRWKVLRGSRGGYTIEVTGPAPVRLMLPKS